MFIIKGKYNIAKVMLPDESFLDEATYSQLISIINTVPAIKGKPIAIMPDCHKGEGSVIGFTMPVNEYIIPNMIGVDIGCGMSSISLDGIDEDNINLKDFDDFMHNNIPTGFNTNADSRDISVMPGLIHMFEALGEKVHCDKVRNSIGTLGGGNHFIEIGVDLKGEHRLVVHSGSRNLGKSVCDYHQKKAKELCSAMAITEKIPSGCEYLPLEFGGKEYLSDMKIAQLYAEANRYEIITRIVHHFFHIRIDDFEDSYISCPHNYIGSDDIIRKGAISSYLGEQIIVPLSSSAGIIFGKGRSNAEWNFSSPHGAGRKMSRSEAKEKVSIDEFRKSMEGVFSTCISESTLDESPQAYKDPELIIEQIAETIDIDFISKPIYSFKDKSEKKHRGR